MYLAFRDMITHVSHAVVISHDTALMKILVILPLSLLATIAITESVFKQPSASEPQGTQLSHDPESTLKLGKATRTGKSVNILLESALTEAFVQEGVNVNIDCLSWLRNFPGGQIALP